MHLSCVQVTFAALVTLALTVAKPPPPYVAATRRDYSKLQCKGVYNVTKFNRLERVCDDCYNLLRSAELYTLCIKECFTSYEFRGCVELLQEEDQIETFKQYIKQLHGADPKVLYGPFDDD